MWNYSSIHFYMDMNMAALLYESSNDQKDCATSWNSFNNPNNHISGFWGTYVSWDFHIYKWKNHV